MTEISFTINLAPVGQMRARHSARGGFAKTYKAKEQRAREDKLRLFLHEHRPAEPFDCPVELCVKAYMPIPKSWPKKKRAQALAGTIRPTTKPDLDNIIKHIKDVMNELFWTDDKLVVGYGSGTGKFYSDQPRWEIVVREWQPSGLLEVA